MNAAHQLIQDITKQINDLPTGEYGEVIFDEERFANLPPPDAFLHPEPDVFMESDGPGLRNRLERTQQPLLGYYRPMRSPGEIVLVRDHLERFYWSLVKHSRAGLPYLFPLDLEGALHLVVKKTDHHEHFHFYSDVLRQMSGATLQPLLEEALAVAWARMQLLGEAWNSKIGRMNRVFHYRIFERAFAYTSPGYRDWPDYADEIRFKSAWLDYLSPPNYRRLQANGVNNLQDLMFNLLVEVTTPPETMR